MHRGLAFPCRCGSYVMDFRRRMGILESQRRRCSRRPEYGVGGEEYHNYARECVRQAGRAHTPEARDKLLDLARVWMDAAVTEEEAATVTDLDPLQPPALARHMPGSSS
jgi:hypothetical protein